VGQSLSSVRIAQHGLKSVTQQKARQVGFSPPPAAAPVNPSFRDTQLKNDYPDFSRKYLLILYTGQVDWTPNLSPGKTGGKMIIWVSKPGAKDKFCHQGEAIFSA
jgi:hypothetical protein